MKEITGKHKIKSNSLPQTIKVKEKYLNDATDIAYEFNKFFTNVGPNLAEAIPPTEIKFDDFMTQSKETLEFQ